MPFEKRDFLKNKLKDICFSTLNSYNFGKVNTNLTESECKSLKELMQRIEAVTQRCSVKKLFLEISQNSNTSGAGVFL